MVYDYEFYDCNCMGDIVFKTNYINQLPELKKKKQRYLRVIVKTQKKYEKKKTFLSDE